MSKDVHGIYLLVGGNLGDPPKTFKTARQMLNPFIRVSSVSSLFITPPWGMESENLFYNQVWEVVTSLSADELLREILRVERDLGRVRENGAGYRDRLIDIDILLFGDEIIDEPHLKVPHPHLKKRAFALMPLLELAPALKDPSNGEAYQTCLGELESEIQKIKRIGRNKVHRH